MSNPIQSTPTPTGDFPANLGDASGSSDLAAECKRWEKRCGELLAERDKMRDDMARMRREYDACRKSLFHHLCRDFKPDFDVKLAFAHIDDKPTLEELIAELQNAPEK